jgi:hypothetical protein
MEAVPADFAVYAQDRWGHSTETKYYTLTPLFLAEFNKNLFQAVSLPNDAVVQSAYESVSKAHFRKFYPIHSCCGKGEIDKFRLLTHSHGVRSGSSIVATQSGDNIMPKAITFDMGMPGNIYRIQFLWRKEIKRIDTYRRSGNTDTKSVWYYVGDDPDPNAASWTKIAEGTYSSGDLLTLTASVFATGRYLKIYLPDSNNGQNTSVAEIDVFGMMGE